MSVYNDQSSLFFPKDKRMIWSSLFIRTWLVDDQLQFISGYSLDSLSTLANSWIQRTAICSHQRYPIVSSQDIKEAALEVLGSEEESCQENLVVIGQLRTIVQNAEHLCQCRTCSLERAGLYFE
jgi:hypothetical protein